MDGWPWLTGCCASTHAIACWISRHRSAGDIWALRLRSSCSIKYWSLFIGVQSLQIIDSIQLSLALAKRILTRQHILIGKAEIAYSLRCLPELRALLTGKPIRQSGHRPKHIHRPASRSHGKNTLATQPSRRTLFNRQPILLIRTPRRIDICQCSFTTIQVFSGVANPNIDIKRQNGLVAKRKIHSADQNIFDPATIQCIKQAIYINVHAKSLSRAVNRGNPGIYPVF